MRALVLGCGEMGRTAVRDLYEYGPFDELVVATRSVDKAETVLGELHGCSTELECLQIDMTRDQPMLVDLLRTADVAVNCIGPNYLYEVPIARAAIDAGTNLVDINDDFETTFEMLELSDQAAEAGVTIVLGLGASPGLTNVLVRAAAGRMDEVEEIRTTWMMCAADPGGLALSRHLIHSLSHRALTVFEGGFREKQSLVDGAEIGRLPPPFEGVAVFHVGHPEPITLSRTFPSAYYVDDKASFDEPRINELIRTLGKLVREAPQGLEVAGRPVTAMDFAAAYLNQFSRRAGEGQEAALSVSVTGRAGGRRHTHHFSSVGRLHQGTGIPAAIGATMLIEGGISGVGVLPPEACIDTDEFIYQLYTRRDVGVLNGRVEADVGSEARTSG